MQDKKTSGGVAVVTTPAPSSSDEALRLGVLLGQRRAFGTIAGRCSAAHAESLRRIKEEKRYLPYAPTWADYCEQVLKTSRRSTDRMIGLLKEFGPVFFEVAELTGIAPDAYRTIATAIQSDGIHFEGNVIALLPENAERAVEAVARLRQEAEPPKGKPAEAEAAAPKINLKPVGWKAASESIAAAATRAEEMGEIFAALVSAGPGEEHRAILMKTIDQLLNSLYDTRRRIAGR